MKCPHCAQHLRLLSPEMNGFGKAQNCSHCGGSFSRHLNLRFIAMWALPALALTWLLQPLLSVFSCVPGVLLLLNYGYILKPLPAAMAPKAEADVDAGPEPENKDV